MHVYSPLLAAVLYYTIFACGLHENCEGNCCSNGKSPPWFRVELPGLANDEIEARICANEHSDSNEDIFIKVFEIYIQ